MPREETDRPFEEDQKGRILDPNPERRRYITEIYYKFINRKISPADLMRISKKKLARLAEVAYVKYKYGRYQEALQIFKMLATLDNLNAYYQTALGGVYQKMGKYVDSVVCYTKATKMNQKELCSYVNRGEIYLRHKNYKKAADDFRHAITLDPVGKNMWANRARSLVIALKRNLDLKKRTEQNTAQAAAPQRPQGQSASRTTGTSSSAPRRPPNPTQK